MRPHVEIIHEDDYVVHPAELPASTGEAVQRNLSVDEEDGSASLRISQPHPSGSCETKCPCLSHAGRKKYVPAVSEPKLYTMLPQSV